jgi:hypothetical protein
MPENSPLIHPIADGLPTRKPSETSSSPSHKATQPQLLTCRELDGRTSATKAFDRLVAEEQVLYRRLAGAAAAAR